MPTLHHAGAKARGGKRARMFAPDRAAARAMRA